MRTVSALVVTVGLGVYLLMALSVPAASASQGLRSSQPLHVRESALSAPYVTSGVPDPQPSQSSPSQPQSGGVTEVKLETGQFTFLVTALVTILILVTALLVISF